MLTVPVAAGGCKEGWGASRIRSGRMALLAAQWWWQLLTAAHLSQEAAAAAAAAPPTQQWQRHPNHGTRSRSSSWVVVCMPYYVRLCRHRHDAKSWGWLLVCCATSP
jgi:hypothetical protein